LLSTVVLLFAPRAEFPLKLLFEAPLLGVLPELLVSELLEIDDALFFPLPFPLLPSWLAETLAELPVDGAGPEAPRDVFLWA
jgi:hypothetical protein